MTGWRGVGLLVCTLACLPVAAVVAPERPGRDPRIIDPPRASARGEVASGAAAERVRQFLQLQGGRWEFSVDRRTGRAVLAEGTGLPLIPGAGNTLPSSVLDGLPLPGGRITLDTLEPLATTFVRAQGDLLVPDRGALELDRALSSIRDRGRLASLYYRWRVDGVPVEEATVFVRINSGNLTQFGAPLVGPIDIPTTPAFDGAAALQRLLSHSGDGEAYVVIDEPALWIQPEEPRADRLDYRLIWKIVYRVPGRIETWEGRVDAQTGKLVGFRDINHYGRVVGGVYPRTVFDADETPVPFPLTSLTLDGAPAVSDTGGGFGYGGELVSSGLDGQFFNTNCQSCSNPSQPDVTTAVGTGRIDFGVGGLDEVGNGFSTPADRNTFYHLNQVRRAAGKWFDGLAWLDVPITSFVNIQDTCNAVYNGNVNFFRSGGGCNNSGEIADVIQHEWGHGLDLNTRGGDGATGEATADIVAMHMTHSPVIGPGFFVNGDPVRNIDPAGPRGLMNTTSVLVKCPAIGTLGPLGREIHCEGEIYGQAAWDLALALVAKHGHHTGWRTSERIFFGSLPDAGGYLPGGSFPVYTAYLNADDDDGNLANGTPNAEEIFSAFDAHGIAGVARPNSPACARPAQPLVQATPQCDRVDLSWNAVAGADHYEVLRGELTLDQALFSLATLPATETGFTDLQVAPGASYWYVVLAVDAAGCESTIENPVPASPLAQSVLSASTVLVDDAPLGNRSGFADPGEQVDLVVTLANFGSVPATGISGTIVSTTPGVTLVQGGSTWPQLAAGSAAPNSDVLRFVTDEQQVVCGDTLQFRFVPDSSANCAAEISFFRVTLGQPTGNPPTFECDDTTPCFVTPSFAGLDSVVPGNCGETVLSWTAATSNCVNATLSYNVYRSQDPAFEPSAATLIAADLGASSFVDDVPLPGQAYHYVVRAFDSRSGEDGNLQRLGVVAPIGPDLGPPIFAGLQSATTGNECGTIALSWDPGTEDCLGPISYEIYRTPFEDIFPSELNRIGSTLATTFVDAALDPGADYTYVVRARDAFGNEEANEIQFTVSAGVVDRVVQKTTFDPDADGWSVTNPDTAIRGNWEWGDPEGTPQQPEDDFSPAGASCWITGLQATLPDGSNNDVDDGQTTLLSRKLDMRGLTSPGVSYARWFSNDQGQNPGEDPLTVWASEDDGSSWVLLEQVDSAPLQWVETTHPLPQGVRATARMRFRFIAGDLGFGGSLVEAGVDDFAVVDIGQGCVDCAAPLPTVDAILVGRSGDDVVIDWSADPSGGARFVVYRLTGTMLERGLRLGSTAARTFVHQDAALAQESFFYRVTAVDACGNESVLP